MTAAEAAWGIIPARAGFTGPLLGVVGGPGGSSPLARGLRRPLRPHGMLRRIIPARAGFTRGMSRSTTTCADHPRSRGVYLTFFAILFTLAGSSPLARGLLRSARRGPSTGRIIPARAGFTRSVPGPTSWESDHPRSRGVYRLIVWDGRIFWWIIPARAGFTARTGSGAARPGDHPRSRGVYPISTSTPTSPSWIIPARAGFTRPGRVPLCAQGDHPRSRGVYPIGAADKNPSFGSSPLARGLHRGP